MCPCCPFAGAQWECLGVHESVCGHLKRIPGSLAALCLTQTESQLIFRARCCGKSSSWHWWSRLGAPGGTGTPHFSWGTSTAEISLPILNCYTQPGAISFRVSTPPTSLNMASYILSYTSLVPKVFRWFFGIVVL